MTKMMTEMTKMIKIEKCWNCGKDLVRDTEHVPEDKRYMCLACFHKKTGGVVSI